MTTADRAWMTRGHHSKNFTFSVRNYFTGALLFRKHLCQKGSDHIVKEPLYQGTSKAAEGYAARQVFKEAKKLKMKVEINWQDQDSSSSKAIQAIYPKSQIMVCGGHAGRSHLKQLQTWARKKKFSKALKDRLKKDFPEVNDARHNKCHCEGKHSLGCGCLSDAFVKQSRNNFSLILSSSEWATEFAQRLRNLYHHAIDEHKWEGGEDYHWIPELYRRMNLPIFGGIEEALKQYGEKRDKKLNNIKEEREKKRRIQRKTKRTQEQEDRKAWSKKHGGDTYDNCNDEPNSESKKQCKCGSTTHSRTSSKYCPLNKRNKEKDNDDESDRSAKVSCVWCRTTKVLLLTVFNVATCTCVSPQYTGRQTTLMWTTTNLKQRAPNSHASVALQPTVGHPPRAVLSTKPQTREA